MRCLNLGFPYSCFNCNFFIDFVSSSRVPGYFGLRNHFFFKNREFYSDFFKGFNFLGLNLDNFLFWGGKRLNFWVKSSDSRNKNSQCFKYPQKVFFKWRMIIFFSAGWFRSALVCSLSIKRIFYTETSKPRTFF